MEIVGLGLLLDEESQLATFVRDGWEPGMHIEANPDVVIDVASNEPPSPKDASDTLNMRTKQMICCRRTHHEGFRADVLTRLPIVEQRLL